MRQEHFCSRRSSFESSFEDSTDFRAERVVSAGRDDVGAVKEDDFDFRGFVLFPVPVLPSMRGLVLDRRVIVGIDRGDGVLRRLVVRVCIRIQDAVYIRQCGNRYR